MKLRSRHRWQRRFDNPITVDGRTLRTLRDATDYIASLPEKTPRQPHWQTAVRELMISADRNGIIMLAQTAMLQAIHHGTPLPKSAQRKRAPVFFQNSLLPRLAATARRWWPPISVWSSVALAMISPASLDDARLGIVKYFTSFLCHRV